MPKLFEEGNKIKFTTLTFLPINKEINTILAFTPPYLEELRNKNEEIPIFEIDITYKDFIGNNYNDRYSINLNNYIYASRTIVIPKNILLIRFQRS